MLEKIAAIFSIGQKKRRYQITAAFFTILLTLAGSLFVAPPTDVSAAPVSPSSQTTTTDQPATQENSTQGTDASTTDASSSGSNCNDELGAIGWFVCPTTGAIAKAIDSIYGVVTDFLRVNPLSTDSSSATYKVWEYAKSITNIVFVVLILVVLISQVTGFGITNYGLKKSLPRIIIGAIMVNLSFIICTLAVDVSNILGYSIHNFFNSIASSIGGADLGGLASLSWDSVIGAIIAGGTIGGIAAITIAGSVGGLIFAVLPAVLGGIIALFAAFLTLAARQALVTLLVMISPLAIVAYLLPNTESLFKKWRDLLTKMLVFFPMFSLLFGASALAGWTIIAASGGNGTTLILGMAVQIFPLIFAPTLLKMSGTILGKLNEAIRKPFAPAQKAFAGYSAEKRAQLNARSDLNGRSLTASIRRGLNYSKYKRADETKTAQEDIGLMNAERLGNQKLGRRIIGYRSDGSAIYSTPQATKEMAREFAHRELQLHSGNVSKEVEEKMGALGDYLKHNNVNTSSGRGAQIQTLVDKQAQNFLESETIDRAIARNNLADKRFYHESVVEANKLGKDSEEYKRLILRGSGADGLSDDKKLRNDAHTAVIADAYQMFEAEREATIKKYTTFFDKNVTKDVKSLYDQMLNDKNIDAIVAAQNVLAKRGDYDEIQKKLSEYMDQDEWLALGSDEANVLGANLLSMDGDATLKRLGKHINMETWRFTKDPAARSKYVTMKEYFSGIDNEGISTKTGGIVELMRGTSIDNMDRAAFGQLIEQADKYLTPEQHDKLVESMLPALISGIPKMDTDGDQIINALQFVTGLKKDRKAGTFEGTANSTTVFQMLSALTPHDLINFKTNEIEIMRESLIQICGGNEEDGKRLYREIQEHAYNEVFTFTTSSGETISHPKLKGTGNISRIKSMDPSVTSTMKAVNKVLLGLEDPAQEAA